MKTLAVPRPFLKWAGGKMQLVDELAKRAPAQFKVYHEPFLGGGAFFFHLYRLGRIRHAVLSDINAELIATYEAIRDRVEEVIHLLGEFPYDRDFYYSLRAKDPWQLSPAERAARMIYLNKTGYNGLYRVNRQGKFNVPFGRYKSPKYYDPENLRAVAIALREVQLVCASFETVLERAAKGDFVYLDPPYVPLSATANFTEYHATGFDLASHRLLRDVALNLDRRGVYVLISNSDTQLVRELYNTACFHIDLVWAGRAINCNGRKRGKVSEAIITNYPVRERRLWA
jgi:DNA adenine methylase